MSNILSDFRHQGCSTCVLPPTIPECDLLDFASTFVDVLELPREELEPLHIYRTPDKRETPLGLTRKDQGYNKRGEWCDGKWYLHASRKGELLEAPHIIDYMRRHAEFQALMERGHDLARRIEPTALEVLHKLDCIYPGWSEEFIRNGVIENLQVRINAYDEKADGEICAIEHCDASGVTLALWESAEGLYFRHDGNDIKVKQNPGYAHIMPGVLLSKRTNGLVKPLLHYVRQPKGIRVTARIGRMSIVVFIDALIRTDGDVPTWEETHPTHAVLAATA